MSSLGGVEILQTDTGIWARPNVAQVVPLIGDGIHVTGNAVLQSGALGFRQVPLTFRLDARADVEAIRDFREQLTSVAYVDHDAQTWGCIVLEFDASMAGNAVWQCTATLLIVEETYDGRASGGESGGSGGSVGIGVIATFPGVGPATQAAFQTMIENMTFDTIKIEDGSYTFRNVAWPDRTLRPLTIQPKAGATVNLDNAADGDFGDPIFAFSGARYITFYGLTGTLRFQHILLAQAGVCHFWNSDHISFIGVQFKNIAGNAAAGTDHTAHCFYISHGCHDILIAGCSAQDILSSSESGGVHHVNGIQMYTGGVGGVIHDITIQDWTVTNGGWCVLAWNNAYNIIVDDADATNCGHGQGYVYNFPAGTTGVISNSNSTASVSTSGVELLVNMVDGGGNSFS